MRFSCLTREKHQRSHAGYKRIISRECHDWVDSRTVACQIQRGDRSLQDLPRTEHHQILDHQSLKAAVDADSGLTIRESAIEFRCCQQTMINAFYDIVKVCKHGRWIPSKPTENHKIQRMVYCQSMLSMAKKAKFFDLILTGDETWIAFNNTHQRLQSDLIIIWAQKISPEAFSS